MTYLYRKFRPSAPPPLSSQAPLSSPSKFNPRKLMSLLSSMIFKVGLQIRNVKKRPHSTNSWTSFSVFHEENRRLWRQRLQTQPPHSPPPQPPWLRYPPFWTRSRKDRLVCFWHKLWDSFCVLRFQKCPIEEVQDCSVLLFYSSGNKQKALIGEFCRWKKRLHRWIRKRTRWSDFNRANPNRIFRRDILALLPRF